MTQTERVAIERLGHHGDGVAAGPIYAQRCLPGEVVEGQRVGDRLEEVKIITPSPDRIAPPCRHFKSCGGCALQHASDAFVAAWKQDQVRAALEAHGLSAPMRDVITSAPNSRRRATLAARRTKKGALVGFHGRASDVITEIGGCEILDSRIVAATPLAEELARIGASRKAALAVLVTVTDNGLDICVRGGKALTGDLRQSLAGLAASYDVARLAWDDDVVVTRQPPVQMFGGVAVTPPPGAFLQATPDGEAALVAAVRDIVQGARRIVDLFAGCGTFSLPLASDAVVHAVEGDAAMMDALDRGWRHADGLRGVSTETRDLFRRPMMVDELKGFDAAVIDPPRAGASAQIAELAASGVPVIAAVSCNPQTFARDAARLAAAGYRLNWVQVVDQFRWSTHVELVASLSLSHTG